MDNLKTIFRLYMINAKLDLLWFLRDTKYCLIYMVSDLICALCSVFGILLLSVNFGGFGDMSRAEVLFLLSFSMVVDGIFMMFFLGNNVSYISRIIGRGQLDHAMIQPVPLWIQLLTQGIIPVSSNLTLICGIIITWYSVTRLSLTVTPVWLLLFIINAVSSTIIIVAIMMLISCLAFYAPAAAEEIAQSGKDLFSVKAYPLGGLNTKAKVIFCGVIPVGLAAWFPSIGLLKLGYGSSGYTNSFLSLLWTPAVAILLTLITTFFFQKGLRYYETYGSPRYSGFGHR